MLLLLVVAAALVAGSQANLIVNGNSTKPLSMFFPYEGCRQDPRNALYSAKLYNYTLVNAKDGGYEMCYIFTVKNQTQCQAYQNTLPITKQDKCCNVGFNKFKFYPNQKCRSAIKGARMKLATSNKYIGISWTYQTMTGSYIPNGSEFVMKLTPLYLEPTGPRTANGTIVCVTLGFPCPTMQDYAHDGKNLEINLYDKKIGNYECCPAGVIPVVTAPVKPAPK